MNRKLLTTALRVLARSISHEAYSARDLEILRLFVPSEERDLPVNQLCRVIIRRELDKEQPLRASAGAAGS